MISKKSSIFYSGKNHKLDQHIFGSSLTYILSNVVISLYKNKIVDSMSVVGKHNIKVLHWQFVTV